MARQEKQQNTKRLPPTKQIPSRKIRHNRNGKPEYKRNVSKPKMGTKTTKNKPIQTGKYVKIQIRMVWENIHTNRQILSVYKNMQHLRISKRQHNSRHSPMDMPIMRITPPQRHQRSNTHTKRSNKN